MKKIKMACITDRAVCVTVPGWHRFYYQSAATGERVWLFDTKYSRSVFSYFCSRGRGSKEDGFSLTIRELYQFREYKNFRLSHVMDRLAVWIDYVLKEAVRDSAYAVQDTCPVHIFPQAAMDGYGRKTCRQKTMRDAQTEI